MKLGPHDFEERQSSPSRALSGQLSREHSRAPRGHQCLSAPSFACALSFIMGRAPLPPSGLALSPNTLLPGSGGSLLISAPPAPPPRTDRRPSPLPTRSLLSRRRRAPSASPAPPRPSAFPCHHSGRRLLCGLSACSLVCVGCAGWFKEAYMASFSCWRLACPTLLSAPCPLCRRCRPFSQMMAVMWAS